MSIQFNTPAKKKQEKKGIYIQIYPAHVEHKPKTITVQCTTSKIYCMSQPSVYMRINIKRSMTENRILIYTTVLYYIKQYICGIYTHSHSRIIYMWKNCVFFFFCVYNIIMVYVFIIAPFHVMYGLVYYAHKHTLTVSIMFVSLVDFILPMKGIFR